MADASALLRSVPAMADDARWAQHYHDTLIDSLACAPAHRVAPPHQHPALRWARSGMMMLTGDAAAAPQMCAAPLTAMADGALAALASLAPQADFSMLDGAQLLAERAALAGFVRAGSRSAGGACRLLQAADGTLAISLVRDDDWSLLPAWLECDAQDWADIEAAVRMRNTEPLVARGRELGLALGASVAPATAAVPWCRIDAGAPWTAAAPMSARAAPRVIDLSSLWAGPLCTHLLQRCGADVIKVESTSRPDGARRGAPAFFDLLNAGKRSVAFDLRSPRGRAQLRALIEQADIVIEASRPRALRQMGIDAQALLQKRPRLSWISISAHGRTEPQAQWIGYGDDAAVAAGLSALQQRACGETMFVGDAIADPLTGIHAALAAWASHRIGGGRLVSLALSEVVRHALAFTAPADDVELRARWRRWTALVGKEDPRVPRARTSSRPAPAFGADTASVIEAFGLPC